jgi:hypothetical protein
MNTENNVLEKRAELKQAFDAGLEKAFPAFLFKAVGHGLQTTFRLQKLPNWVTSAIVFFLLFIFLPGFLVAILTGEIRQWQTFHLFYFALIPFGYCSSIVCYINVTYNFLPGIRDDVIGSILAVEDLNRLGKWLDKFWSIRGATFFSLVVGSLTAAAFTITLTLSLGSFIGFGLMVLTFLVAPFYVGPLYVVFHTITLPTTLARSRLRLYEADPINSEIIQRLMYFLNIYVYWVAGYTAVGTTLVSLNPITSRLVWIAILIGWVPSVIQFLIIQFSVRKIIITAKWQNLNKLQVQIKGLQNTNLVEAPDGVITRLNQLMDLHDRISARPNSILNWGTGLSFLNQLMLPLLGLLLGNIDKLLKLLSLTP